MTDAQTDAPARSAVRFDTKIVVALREDLAPWQSLNVASFLVSGITVSEEGLTGEPYRDADGTEYAPMLREPVMVRSANLDQLRRARAKAVSRADVAIAIYTAELFSTTHDAENRAAVEAVAGEELDLVGVAVRGPRNSVDRVMKATRIHP